MLCQPERKPRIPSHRIGRAVLVAVALAAGSALGLALPASAGVTGPAFYVNGVRTAPSTPRPTCPAPTPHRWDTIYDVGGSQLNIATATSCDAGYSGGRWQVHALAYPEELHRRVGSRRSRHRRRARQRGRSQSALDDGAAVGTGIVKQFEYRSSRFRAPETALSCDRVGCGRR